MHNILDDVALAKTIIHQTNDFHDFCAVSNRPYHHFGRHFGGKAIWLEIKK